jgi:hypothetical protein
MLDVRVGSSGGGSGGRWARATVVALPSTAVVGKECAKWTLALHGVWLDDVSRDGVRIDDVIIDDAVRDDASSDDLSSGAALFGNVEVPLNQADDCLRLPWQPAHQPTRGESGGGGGDGHGGGEDRSRSNLSGSGRQRPSCFAEDVAARAAKRRRLGGCSAAATPAAAATPGAPSQPTAKRLKLPTSLTNALLKDLDGGNPSTLAATVRDAGGGGWRATTRFAADGVAALLPSSAVVGAGKRHAQLRGSFQRVAALEDVLCRLTALQTPPAVQGALQPSQEPPPGGVQSLAELEAALEALLVAADAGSAPATHQGGGGGRAALATAAATAAGRLALASLAACWGRSALWELLARSAVRGRPASEGLVALAAKVLGAHAGAACAGGGASGGASAFQRAGSAAAAVGACGVATQCLGLVAAVRGPGALREPLRAAAAHRRVPCWAGHLVADALATYRAQFNAQDQAAHAAAAAMSKALGSKAIVAVAGTSSSSDELSKPSGAAALPSGCFKPPSLDVNNAMQLA